jgi:uncharacterized Zn-binding protein involved in type VI secretion
MPAARLGDTTSHGTPLSPGPGCPTVLVGGRPAWRVGDQHACPLWNGPSPHGMGAVAAGSLSVFIGGQPAARVGDAVIEAGGGPDPIAVGAFNVLIG